MKKTTTRSAKGREKVSGEAQAINRILVGVRIEPRLVKVMKALAELHDCALGELIEKVFWTSMEGGNLFSERNGRASAEVRQQIQSLKQVYGVTYSLEDLMKPRERRPAGSSASNNGE